MSFQDAVHKLGEKSAADVLKLYALVPDGTMTQDEFVRAAVTAITTANAQGVALAEMSLNALLELSGLPTIPGLDLSDVTHWLEEDRLDRAVRTSLEAEATAATRLDRLARSEPVEAAQRAFGSAMKQSGDVEGWERDLEGEACQLCTWWWRDGRVWPTSHEMPTHKGCECTQRPVLTDYVEKVSRKAQNESADRAAFGDADARRLVDPSRYSKRSVKS